MNKKVLATLALTIIATIVLTLYSFGPLSGMRKSVQSNPVSLKPARTQTVAVALSTGTVFTGYENKDRTENYYSIAFPATWNVSAAANPGGYAVQFSVGNGTVELMDVPDTSTLELFVLSQEEPKLKQSLQGYKRLDYKKMTLNGSDAYQLVYQHSLNGAPVETARTYAAGKDMSNVLTFTSALPDFPRMQPVFSAVLQKFQWLTP